MPHDRRRSRSPPSRSRSRSPRKEARQKCSPEPRSSSGSYTGLKLSESKHRSRDPVHHGHREHHHRDHRRHDHHHHHHKGADNHPAQTRNQRRPRRDSQASPSLDPHRPIKQEPVDERSSSVKSKWESEREENDRRRIENRRHRMHEPHPLRAKDEGVEYEYGQPNQSSQGEDIPPVEKEQPNFGLSGKLTEDTNTFKGVVIKYNEPPEARKPKKKWRLYPFKGEQGLPVLHLHRQSGYLIGRERKIADIPVDHPSCSKQHAVLQFRAVDFERADGTTGRRVRPYVIDLNSANGTFVNNQRIESQRYLELFEKDVIKFGFSTREYVLLHDSVDTSELNDEADAAD